MLWHSSSPQSIPLLSGHCAHFHGVAKQVVALIGNIFSFWHLQQHPYRVHSVQASLHHACSYYATNLLPDLDFSYCIHQQRTSRSLALWLQWVTTSHRSSPRCKGSKDPKGRKWAGKPISYHPEKLVLSSGVLFPHLSSWNPKLMSLSPDTGIKVLDGAGEIFLTEAECNLLAGAGSGPARFFRARSTVSSWQWLDSERPFILHLMPSLPAGFLQAPDVFPACTAASTASLTMDLWWGMLFLFLSWVLGVSRALSILASHSATLWDVAVH